MMGGIILKPSVLTDLWGVSVGLGLRLGLSVEKYSEQFMFFHINNRGIS